MITHFDQMGIVVGRFDFKDDRMDIPYNTLRGTTPITKHAESGAI